MLTCFIHCDAAGTDDYDYSGAEEGEYGEEADNSSNNNKLVKRNL